MPLFLLIGILFCRESYALSPDNVFQDDRVIMEKILLSKPLKNLNFKPFPSDDSFNQIIKDPKNRISKDFKINSFFRHIAKFWFFIYTKYDSNYVIVHDKKNLNFIYDVIDFTELGYAFNNKNIRFSLQAKLGEGRVQELRKTLHSLIKVKKKYTAKQRSVLALLKKYKIKIPRNLNKRKRLFKSLGKNIRTQTGQKDNIIQGLKNYLPFKRTLSQYFKIFDVPKELIAVPFLESSFNLLAISKYGATGPWQFMRFIGSKLLKIDKNQDGRLNPFISTLGALHLLKQNYRILKRWDLAVTAYNSGTKHILLAKRKTKNLDLTLEEFIKDYNNPHLGFASKNFWGAFLALVYSISYQKTYLKIKYEKPLINFNPDTLNLYITLCRFKPKTIFNYLKKHSPHINFLNSHLLNNKKSMPRGTILFSDRPLTDKRYLKVTGQKLRRLFPLNYSKYIRGIKCRN